MNILQLYLDYNIPHQTEGNKHCQPGWVQIDCPFCKGDLNMHLGCHIERGYFNCWRCGWHPAKKVIATLLGIKEAEAQKILQKYNLNKPIKPKQPSIKIKLNAFKFPSGTTEMTDRHKQYLEKRGFDPDKLEHDWGLRGTGPIARLDKIDFKHRILVPIYWDDKPVSFQTRDITNKSKLPYITCPKERELVFHKSIVFGKQYHWRDTGICVEGLFDVFRFGFNSFATFGIEFIPAQVTLIAKTFKRVPVVFDGEEVNAQIQAHKLVTELRFRKVISWVVDIKGDPGAMKQDDADYLVKQLIK